MDKPKTTTGSARSAKAVEGGAFNQVANPALDPWNYWVDAYQRSVLFLDVMRQRSERYAEHAAKDAPHVLKFACDLVMDGRKLQRPVNYALVRVKLLREWRPTRASVPSSWSIPAPATVRALAASSPRAKSALHSRLGIPAISSASCPSPIPGQTIEDIARAEAAFLERVIALHPDADGKPCGDRQLPGRLGGHDGGRDAA